MPVQRDPLIGKSGNSELAATTEFVICAAKALAQDAA
jgi:hypothetical protein